ncbi:hypothetical protein [Bradyrhizobium sp. NP1]|uniref:hypothetical protein n=1 Tax=Bradyrhizobium sp. NP1 TaxID=3049772 RepID=UPI0025A501F5|nr:hypothetical protein [Bradyrhizobium sp. NP1]WJR79330.1 hypothetical protein QOU61_05965 [Bradyrhizobium sp. NP1]
MPREGIRKDQVLLISRVAHVVERIGLAMSGAVCGMFVAALLARSEMELSDPAAFILSMMAIGAGGFSLGIDISVSGLRPRLDPLLLLGAAGTFLAAVAALISVYAFVFDEVLRRGWDMAVAAWWVVGVAMQIGAGLTRQLGAVRKSGRQGIRRAGA